MYITLRYFISIGVVKGRCSIVRRITLLETSKVIGKYDSCRRVTKYKRIPHGDIDKYLNYDKNTKKWKSKNLMKQRTTVDTKGTLSVAVNFLQKQALEFQPNNLLKRQQNRSTLLKQRQTNARRIPASTDRMTSNLSLKPNGEYEDEIVDEFVDNGEEARIIHKYLVVNRLERGDSFGFGEDLRNIFIITASQIDCLIIPSHIMMRAERHVENINRKSQQQSVEQMTNQMRRRKSLAANYDQYAAQKKQNNNISQQSNRTNPSGDNNNGSSSKPNQHHYVELRQMIEDKIPSERLSYERWRLNEDWNSYKAQTLQEVINNKTKK